MRAQAGLRAPRRRMQAPRLHRLLLRRMVVLLNQWPSRVRARLVCGEHCEALFLGNVCKADPQCMSSSMLFQI